MEQNSNLPTQKINSAGIAAFIVVIVLWAVKQWGKVDVPPEVAAALTGVISYVTAYLTPPAPRDTIKES